MARLAPHDMRRTCARLATYREVSWSRSNFSWGTFRCRRPNATLVASSGFDQLSMIALASSRILELGGGCGRVADHSFSIVRTAPRRRDCHKRPHTERIIARRLPLPRISSGISLRDTRLRDANGCSVALEFLCLSIAPMTRFSHGSGYEAKCEWKLPHH